MAWRAFDVGEGKKISKAKVHGKKSKNIVDCFYLLHHKSGNT